MTSLAIPLLLAGLAATPVALSAEPSLPELQEAYEKAAAQAGSTHVKGLTIVGSQCNMSDGKFFCQIGFRIEGEADERVYLDVATVEPLPSEGFSLVSGLCRR